MLTEGDHEHFSTPSWGGYDLTEDFLNPDLIQIHQVTIQFSDAATGGAISP